VNSDTGSMGTLPDRLCGITSLKCGLGGGGSQRLRAAFKDHYH